MNLSSIHQEFKKVHILGPDAVDYLQSWTQFSAPSFIHVSCNVVIQFSRMKSISPVLVFGLACGFL